MSKRKQKKTPSIKQYAGYFRVSTAGQGESGAGLEAQRQAVLSYINGGAELVREFQEVESGTKDRPELQKAIAFCKQTDAVLVVSKLDRLARSVWLFENIKRAGIQLEIVGLPKEPMVQQIMAAVSQNEARLIAERTKAALKVKKEQGVKLGYDRPEVKAGVKRYWRKKKKEIAARPKAAKAKGPSKREIADKKIIPHLRLMRKNGATYEKIAAALNESGLKARWGGDWSKQQLHTVAKRNGIA